MKLLFLLLFPHNQGIKERYDNARRQLASATRTLAAAPFTDMESDGHHLDRHCMTRRTVARLLTDPSHAAKLVAYREAIKKEDNTTLISIEDELG